LPAAGCAFLLEGFAVLRSGRDLSRRLRYGLFETFDVYGLVGRNDVRHGCTSFSKSMLAYCRMIAEPLHRRTHCCSCDENVERMCEA
jgi:hypothetical protein